LVLADGAGGTGRGRAAAERVIAEMEATAATAPAAWDPATQLVRIDAELERAGGWTTAVVVEVAPGRLRGASAGDSIAWLIGADGAVDELTAGQQQKPLLGAGARPVTFTRAWPDRATLLLASDGLWRYAPTAAIVETAGACDLEQAADRLAALPRLPSGALQDDVALILARADAPVGPTAGSADPTRSSGRSDR
jgi:serine/threonine protein phosphatase PrpC